MAIKTKYSPLQHMSLDNLFTALGELSPRNKAIALGTTAVLLLLILFLPLSLLSGKVKTLKKEIQTAQKGYSQVVDRVTEYQRIQSEIEELEKRFGGSGGALTSRIEAIARESGIAVDQMREKPPQETDYLEITSIEVKLSNISISQLMEFLFNLENDRSSPMRLRRIQVKPKSNNRQLLDVSCEVATFVLRKEV